MPDEGYISLVQWRQREFSIADFLTIAVKLAEILHGLYQNRVIHKDIKPANILIHPQTQQVKLIDFNHLDNLHHNRISKLQSNDGDNTVVEAIEF